MSSYFRAADRCGLRINLEECKRVVHRTVVETTPTEILAETEKTAADEAHSFVKATRGRLPDSTPITIEEAQLPLYDERQAHLDKLRQQSNDIARLERRDHDDYQQRAMAQAKKDQILQEALCDEQRRAQEALERQRQSEVLSDERRGMVRQQLRSAYGPSFMWSESRISLPKTVEGRREAMSHLVDAEISAVHPELLEI